MNLSSFFRSLNQLILIALFLLPSLSAHAGLVVLVGDTTPDGDNFPTLDCGDAANPCDTIQNGVDVANPGDTLQIAAMTFEENVVINKPLTLTGAGQGQTLILPAVSAPNPCNNSSLCGGAASTILLVEADDVLIQDMTLDGNNPGLTSGVVLSGEDVDARIGIITNFLVDDFDNLEVANVTVQNVYLRGIQSGSATFNFHDNSVSNVQGDGFAIALFNFGGSGTFANNQVSNCTDGIASNWSGGTQYLNNQVTGCLSGIHSDNAGGSAAALYPNATSDLIQGNTVSDCEGPQDGTFGVWTFVSYVPQQVEANRVENCDYGLAMFGQQEGEAPVFLNNHSENNGTGVLITTDITPYGSRDISGVFVSNQIVGNQLGILLQAQDGFVLDADFAFNRIVGNADAGVQGSDDPGTYNVALANNWWGCNEGPNDAAGDCDTVEDFQTYDPWLILTLEAPAQATAGERVGLRAHTFFNSNGEDVSAMGLLPDILSSFHSTTLGQVDPEQVIHSLGASLFDFVAPNAPGLADVSVTLDNETVTQSIEVVAGQAPTPLVPSSFFFGSGGCRLGGSAPVSFGFLWLGMFWIAGLLLYRKKIR